MTRGRPPKHERPRAAEFVAPRVDHPVGGPGSIVTAPPPAAEARHAHEPSKVALTPVVVARPVTNHPSDMPPKPAPAAPAPAWVAPTPAEPAAPPAPDTPDATDLSVAQTQQMLVLQGHLSEVKTAISRIDFKIEGEMGSIIDYLKEKL